MTDVELLQFCVLVMLDDFTVRMVVWRSLCLCVQDGQAMLWDLNEGKHLYTLDSGDVINALSFSPNRYWLCAATGPSIKIWVPSALWFMTGFTHLSWLDCVCLVMLYFIVVFHCVYFIDHNSVSIIRVVCEVCHAGSLASIWICHICFIHGNTQHWKSSPKLIKLRSSNAINGHFKFSMYCNDFQCKMNKV